MGGLVRPAGGPAVGRRRRRRCRPKEGRQEGVAACREEDALRGAGTGHPGGRGRPTHWGQFGEARVFLIVRLLRVTEYPFWLGKSILWHFFLSNELLAFLLFSTPAAEFPARPADGLVPPAAGLERSD